jgi:hypothetical protein
LVVIFVHPNLILSTFKGADHLTFEGGGGWKISKKNFVQPKEKKKIMQHAIEKKKNHAKESAQKKNSYM